MTLRSPVGQPVSDRLTVVSRSNYARLGIFLPCDGRRRGAVGFAAYWRNSRENHCYRPDCPVGSRRPRRPGQRVRCEALLRAARARSSLTREVGSWWRKPPRSDRSRREGAAWKDDGGEAASSSRSRWMSCSCGRSSCRSCALWQGPHSVWRCSWFFALDDGAVTGSTVREHCYLRHSANRRGGAFSAAVMGRPRVVRITANQGETL